MQKKLKKQKRSSKMASATIFSITFLCFFLMSDMGKTLVFNAGTEKCTTPQIMSTTLVWENRLENVVIR